MPVKVVNWRNCPSRPPRVAPVAAWSGRGARVRARARPNPAHAARNHRPGPARRVPGAWACPRARHSPPSATGARHLRPQNGEDTRSPARHPGRRGHGHGAHSFPRAVRPVGIGVARGAMHAPPARLAAVAPPFRGRARRLVAQGPCLAPTDPVGTRRRRGVMRLGLPGPLSVSLCGEVDFRMCLGAGVWTPTGHRAAVSALCLRLVFK